MTPTDYLIQQIAALACAKIAEADPKQAEQNIREQVQNNCTSEAEQRRYLRKLWRKAQDQLARV